MRVVGIDPGLNITGYGVLEGNGSSFKLIESGCVTSRERDPMPMRIRGIYEDVLELFREMRPQAAAVEQLYSHYKHPMTAILMGHARGVICLLAKRSGAKLVGYPATRIKKALTGAGHASKHQMQRMIQGLFGMAAAPEPPDISDALALAVAHAYMAQKEPVTRLTLKVNRGKR